MIFKGLRIKIENPAGSVRSGVDHVTGKKWSTKLSHDYGEIIGTHGVDGDPVDVFIGPDKSSPFVFVVHQLQKQTGSFDEDKCFLGFSDSLDAKAAYMKNFDTPVFYGSIETIPFQEFKNKVLSNKGDTMIHAKMDVTVGDPVVADGLRGRGVIVSEDGSDVVIRYRNGEYFKRKKYNVHHMGDNTYKSRYSSVRAGGPGSGPRPGQTTPSDVDQIVRLLHPHHYDNPMEKLDPRLKIPRGSAYGKVTVEEALERARQRKEADELGVDRSIHSKKVGAARLEPVEMEGNPITVPHGTNKRIVKRGTNFCVVSDGVDKDFGCYNSRAQAEAVLNGKSFITPDIPDNLYGEGLKAFGDLGEPMAGSMGHAHIEPEFWFHPPSQKRPDYVPVDDPGEKDNKFLDVTKRKKAHEDRMKRLKRSAPGGLPAYIPAHTTLLGSSVKLKRKGSKLLLDTLEPRTSSLKAPHAVSYTKGIKARRTKDERMRKALNSAHI